MASSKKTLTLLVFCGTFGSQTKYMYMFPNLSLFLLGQLKSPLEAGQVSSTITCHSIGDGLGPAGLELNCKSMGAFLPFFEWVCALLKNINLHYSLMTEEFHNQS